MLFIDLDNFKDINDSLGHDAGDRVLKLVTERLLETVRKSDLLFRIGGDEFSLILSKIGDEADASLVRSIIGISQGLGLEIIAEGVETAEQLGFLKSAGCGIIQGYFFSKPIPAPDFLLFAGKRVKGGSNL